MSKRNQQHFPAFAMFSTVAIAVLLMAPAAQADHGDCGQPVSKGNRPASVDALVALKTSVHLQHCSDSDAQGDEDDCRCDVDASGDVTVRDSLTILRTAVGFAAELDCEDSCGGPGTTVAGGTSTTLEDDDDQGDDDHGVNGDDADDDDGDHEGSDDSTTTTTTPL